MPANFTINPRTHVIDYILVHPELLSMAAFKQGITAAVANSEGDVQTVIPAYLNEDHFQRVLPLLPGVLKVLLFPRYCAGLLRGYHCCVSCNLFFLIRRSCHRQRPLLVPPVVILILQRVSSLAYLWWAYIKLIRIHKLCHGQRLLCSHEVKTCVEADSGSGGQCRRTCKLA